MLLEPHTRRPHDSNKGSRVHMLGIRCTNDEMTQITKLANKLKMTKSALVMSYFNAHKKYLKENETK